MLKLTDCGPTNRSFIRLLRVMLIVPGAIIMELAPALALDGSNASTGKGLPFKSFTSGQEALRLGEEDLRG